MIFLLLVLLIIGCNKEEAQKEKKWDGELNTLTAEFEFPNEVYTNRKYSGKITFFNSIFDTIAQPRRDTSNFRFITYKPFKPYLINDDRNLVYQDSILLENNVFEFDIMFDKTGVYHIGGEARDGIMIGYYTGNIRDSVDIIEHEINLVKKVIVRDSI